MLGLMHRLSGHILWQALRAESRRRKPVAALTLQKRATLVWGVASIVAASAVSSSFGAIKSWDAGGGVAPGNTWSEGLNWDADTAPMAGDDLRFPTLASGNRVTNNDFAPGTSFGSLTFSASAYSVAGNSFTLSGNLFMTAGSTSSIATINAPLALSHDTEIQVLGAASGTQPRLELGADVSGNFSVTKTGTGNIRILTGVKTYTGNTYITAGTVDITSGALPSGAGKGDVFLNAGAFLFSNNVAHTINGLNDGTAGGGTVTKSGNGSRTITIGSGDANGAFSGGFSLAGTGGAGTAVTKTGAGTQVFSGTLTAAGQLPNLNANGGRLLIDGSFGFAGPTTIGAGGLLGGAGTVGNVTANGKLAPGGNLAGDTTAVFSTGNLTINATGEVDFDIDGLARGSSYDGVNLSPTGVLAYGGGKLVLDLGVVAPGTYDLFSFTAVPAASNLGSISVTGALSGGLTGMAGVWTGTFGSATLTFTESTGDLVVAVPEPTSLAAFGVLTLIARRRRHG
jgi:autotransporter-associated beta strand protein